MCGSVEFLGFFTRLGRVIFFSPAKVRLRKKTLILDKIKHKGEGDLLLARHWNQKKKIFIT